MSATINFKTAAREMGFAAKFGGVGLIGFAVDAALLRLGLWLGLQPAWARVISLTCAMHATFLINGLLVFQTLRWRTSGRQWLAYMLANGFGNFCNYWIFVTLVSLHWRPVSTPLFALSVGSACAWAINFAGTRLFVFRRTVEVLAAPVPSSKPAAGGRRSVL
jgi:putative flippase GtrA